MIDRNLRGAYETLVAHPTGHAFSAALIDEASGTYLGVDAGGRPALFVSAREFAPGAPVRSAHASLRLNLPFELHISKEAAIVGRYHCLRCEATDAATIDTFLMLLQAFVSAHDEITADDLVSFFKALVRLFSVGPARDPNTERQGLWGELFMMRSVRGFEFWLPFWHSDPRRRFDFTAGQYRVEVKTTASSARIHHFSHRQVFPVDNEEIVIASLLLQEDDSGLALKTLVDECRQVATMTPHFFKLEKAVRRTGMDDPIDTGPAYDSTAAASNLRWFQSHDVPHFRVAEPAGVLDTRYRVDLTLAPALAADEANEWLNQWNAILDAVA